MTKQISELRIDELDQVSGGGNVFVGTCTKTDAKTTAPTTHPTTGGGDGLGWVRGLLRNIFPS